MSPESKPLNAFFLVGPTAIGKSAVAHVLADRTGKPILSTDAMVVYKGMDIGTDKPDAETLSRYTYYGVDLAEPDEPFSVGKYLQGLRTAFSARPVADGEVIAVGGTGLYVKCLTEGLDELPAENPDIRAEYERQLEEKGIGALQDSLRKMSSEIYEALADKENPRRLVRALEWVHAGAKPRKVWLSGGGTVLIGLKMDRDMLYSRLVTRVHRMFESGLIDEVEHLEKKYEQLSNTARQAIGYQEAFCVLRGELTRDEAMEKTIIRTRQLAKRQMTWFRNQCRVHWVEILPGMTTDDIAQEVSHHWSIHGPNHIHI